MSARPRQVEGHARDPLDFVLGVDLGIDGALLAVLHGHDLFRLAEIDAARQFADDHEIEAFDHLALEAGRVRQRRIADGGPQIREKPQILAQTQEPSLGPLRIGNLVPFRAAHRAEKDGIRSFRLFHGGVRDRLAMGVIGAAADEILLDFELSAAGLAEPCDHAFDLGHDLGADAVAGKEKQFFCCHDQNSTTERVASYDAGKGAGSARRAFNHTLLRRSPGSWPLCTALW